MKKILLFLTCAIAEISISQVNLNSSLTACYNFNNTPSEPINNLTGTLSAATATVDRFNNAGSAFYFNGNLNCYIKLPDHPLIKPANGLSFSIWVKPSQNSAAHIIYTRNNLNSNFEAYQLCIYSGAPVFRINKSSSSGNNIVLSTTTVTPGNWYHIVGTFDNTSLKLYINGVLEGTTASTFNGFDYMSGKEVFIGNSNESFNFPFLGSLDNLRFYDRTLNQAEVTALYNQDPSCLSSSSVPTASFSVNTQTACVNQPVNFTDLSTNSPTSWFWQVPGASSSNPGVANPTFSFTVPGLHTASLTVANSFGNSTNTATQNIMVYPQPTVSISASNTIVCRGESVLLTGNGALSYQWFNTQTAPSITVNLNVSGNFSYSVTGIDQNGCSNTATVLIKVSNCVGVAENAATPWILYPNPANYFLQVSSSGVNISTLSIHDIAGNVVYETSGTALLGPDFRIDLSHIAAGVYFIAATSAGAIRYFKIIKQ